MPVGVQRCLNVLVTEPIANLQGACTHVNQMGGVAVPEKIQTFGFFQISKLK